MILSESGLQKITSKLFYVGVLVFLYPLLTNTWMVTGDGPCHLYNAKVLKDIIFNIDKAFYLDFYMVNYQLTPNLWDHILLGFFQIFFSPSISEKLFFGTYILAFSFGARYLCRSISPNSDWAVLSVLLFTFHHLMMKGFLNYTFSFAASFWVMGYYISHKNDLKNWKTAVKLALLLTINYFMHPIGFIFALAGVAFITLADLISILLKPNAKEVLLDFLKKVSPLALIVLPSILLYLSFVMGSSFSKPLDWNTLINIDSLMTYADGERPYSLLVGKFAIVILILGVINRIKNGPIIHITDGLLLLCLFFVFLFHANLINDSMIGGDRLKFLPHICILLWMSSLRFALWFKALINFFALVIIFIFAFLRYPSYAEASAWVDDYMECEEYILPKTKVLTLNYDYNGTTVDGRLIAPRNWTFMHGTSYLGAKKPLILSDNYQAHMSWFPINWKDQKFSFYNATGKDGMCFEDRPPRAIFTTYAEKTGKTPIEYVLVIGKKAMHMDHPNTIEVDSQLVAKYNVICKSKSGRSVLYGLKN
jgi:hypothetical protein